MIDDILRNTEFLSTFLWKIKARRENLLTCLEVQTCLIIALSYLKTWVIFYLLVSGHRIKHSPSRVWHITTRGFYIRGNPPSH